MLALTIPDTGDGRLPARATAIALAAGLILYLVVVRRRIQRGTAGLPQGNGPAGPTHSIASKP